MQVASRPTAFLKKSSGLSIVQFLLGFTLLGLTIVGWSLLGCAGDRAPREGERKGEEAAADTEPWDVVILTDSYGWGVGEIYADSVRASQGVEVRLHDRAVGGLCAADALEALRGNPSGYEGQLEGVRGLVEEAEVLVFAVNGTCSVDVDRMGNPFWAPYGCGVIDSTTFDLFRERLGAAYQEIKAIRGDSPLLIRTFEAYAPTVQGWREAGRYDACRAAVLGYNQAIRDAADAHQVPAARLRLAFNGPDFQEDPVQKGLIGPDNVHTNEQGRALIANLLHNLGYR